MRYFSALIGTGCALLSLPVDGRFSMARAQHRSVNTMNERQLTERLTVTPSVVLVDVRLAHERAKWTIQCARCTVVSAPYDFENDGWTVTSAGERYIQKVRAAPGVLDTLRQRDVVVICLEGVRAEAAAHALVQLGLNPATLAGGLNGLKQPWLLGKREQYR